MSRLCQELQDIAERVFAGTSRVHDVVINISPGTSKSTIGSILFHPWTWTRMLSARHLTATHTETLALDLANKSRWVIRSDKYQRCFPEVILRGDQDAKSYYANTAGGVRQAFTVSGKNPMGFHFHFLGVDDPLDPQKAVSEAELSNARSFMTETLPSRRIDKKVSVTYLIMQRLHRDDPTAVMVSKGKMEHGTPVRHICLPAELPAEGIGNVSPPDLAEKYVDGLMDVNRLSRSVLREYQSNLGAYGYAGQFLQNPTPLGGGMFKETYFVNRVKAAPYQARRIRYWDRACLVADTQVETINGPVPIQNVRVGDLVLTRAGYKKVVWSGETKRVDGLTRVEFSNGSVLEGTGDHRVWTENKGWIPMDTLDGSCYSVGIKGGTLCHESRTQILSMFPLKESRLHGSQEGDISQPCDGIESPKSIGPIRSIGQSGDSIMGIFPKAVTYTIRTAIGTTTKSVIWSASQGKNTTKNMGFLRNGTRLQPGRNIKRNLMKHRLESFETGNHASLCVNNVGLDFCQNMGMFPELDFAPKCAVNGIGLVGSQRFVRYASMIFGEDLGHTLAQKNARSSSGRRLVRSVRGILKRDKLDSNFVPKVVEQNGSIPVYDLEVESEHEFFANGVLVHNSLATGGCYTAGVLMGEYEGNYYVEDVVHGQWEPDERNNRIRAAALRDRAKYGPRNTPLIVVEAEGGSSGKDSYKMLAKVLAGFNVKEDRVTGAKDVRAEPWAAQCAAGNVYLVDNGQSTGESDALWDVFGYVQEHVLFKPEPGVKRLGKYKDQVDASSGAFNLLVRGNRQSPLRTYSLGPSRQKFHVVVCNPDDLASFVTEHRSIMVNITDPISPTEGLSLPPMAHGLNKLLDSHLMLVADIQPADYQENWDKPVERFGKKPEELILDQQGGKKLWAFLLKKRDPAPELFVISDMGGEDRRALSVALAIVDTMGLPRTAIHIPSDEERFSHSDNVGKESAGNQHLYDMVRATRGMVSV